MNHDNREWGERLVRLVLAIDEHLPGYVDAYFGPEGWRTEAKEAGKMPLSDLARQTEQLASDLSQAGDLDAQRSEYLVSHVTAMQMSLRLLQGEHISLEDEVEAVYDVRPVWKDESNFEEAHRLLDEVLPGAGSLRERTLEWERSLEISIEKVKEILPVLIRKLRRLTHEKFGLPEGENFTVEFVSNQPWTAYNWYLGNFQSRIDLNTDMPSRISFLPALLAHEGYPGHHTDLCIKEKLLVQQSGFHEFTVNLLNTPSALMAEGIATTALKALLTDEELEAWFREELLPAAGMKHIDPKRIFAIGKAGRKMNSIDGNAAFMLHDQHRSEEEIRQYLLTYGLVIEQEAKQTIDFISNPLYRSYVFTYHMGYELLEELFQHVDRRTYFQRMLQEPVTPGIVRQWISDVTTQK